MESRTESRLEPLTVTLSFEVVITERAFFLELQKVLNHFHYGT